MRNITTCGALISSLILGTNVVSAQIEPPAGSSYSPYPQKVFVTKVKHFDNMCWKIAAAGGTWYFENGETSGKTGFSSAFDQLGNDWIGNDADKGYNTSPKGTGKHEYRGFPNLGNGDFDHPQRSSGSKTKWVNESGVEIPFSNQLEGDHLIMRSYNSKYEVEYHFFTTHIALKIIKALDKFAFLYEGPIGGEQESNTIDKWYTKDGSANTKPCGTTSCSSPFIYFVDSNPKDTQILYLGAANLTSGVGGEAYVAANNMVVVSYGRSGNYPNDTRKLTGTAPISVIGFLNKADGHSKISTFIENRLSNPFKNVVTDIEEEDQTFNFKVFPNPSSEGFNIHSANNAFYTIYDITGNLIENGSLEGISQIGTSLNTGIYFLKVETPTEIRTIKITKK